MKSRLQSVMSRHIAKGKYLFRMSSSAQRHEGQYVLGDLSRTADPSAAVVAGRSALFFCGMGLCMFGVNEFQLQSDMTEKTSAVILKRDIVESRNSLFPMVDLTYSVKGTYYKKKDTYMELPNWVPTWLSPSHFQPNQRVSLAYNPKNPAQSRVENNFEFAGKSFMMGVYVLFLAL